MSLFEKKELKKKIYITMFCDYIFGLYYASKFDWHLKRILIKWDEWWMYLLWGKASYHWCTWDSRRWRCGSLQTSPAPAPPTTTWWRRCHCTSSSSADAGRRCKPSSGRRWPGLHAPALHEADKGPGEDMRGSQQSWCWSASYGTQ